MVLRKKAESYKVDSAVKRRMRAALKVHRETNCLDREEHAVKRGQHPLVDLASYSASRGAPLLALDSDSSSDSDSDSDSDKDVPGPHVRRRRLLSESSDSSAVSEDEKDFKSSLQSRVAVEEAREVLQRVPVSRSSCDVPGSSRIIQSPVKVRRSKRRRLPPKRFGDLGQDAQQAIADLHNEEDMERSSQDLAAIEASVAREAWVEREYVPTCRPNPNPVVRYKDQKLPAKFSNRLQPIKQTQFAMLVADSGDPTFKPEQPYWLCKIVRSHVSRKPTRLHD